MQTCQCLSHRYFSVSHTMDTQTETQTQTQTHRLTHTYTHAHTHTQAHTLSPSVSDVLCVSVGTEDALHGRSQNVHTFYGPLRSTRANTGRMNNSTPQK